MTYRGTVRKGVVVLDGGVTLDEGTTVEVQPVAAPSEQPASQSPPTLYERYKQFIGAADGLPSDFAAEHDHYIHGTPKRTAE